MESLKEYIAEKVASKVNLDTLTIMQLFEKPNATFGDLALPCFKFAKIIKKNPVIIAKELAEDFTNDGKFDKVESVNAYINFTFKRIKNV